MQWDQLLTHRRLGKPTQEPLLPGRSPFQRDFDRIIFCSAFRRLQDKTQVFPLSKSDYVRTRLTHSLEASCVGRSLGTEVGLRLKQNHSLPESILPSEVGTIVATACLAHDIGNPPFGHTGEEAIRLWFLQHQEEVLDGLDEKQKQDFLKFEGNAQGFRILTRLQHPDSPGMQLTYPTLAAFTKYPRESLSADSAIPRVGIMKKHGYFQSEREYFDTIAEGIGLVRRDNVSSCWARHPLAFLTEAADDICYHIIDLEDGFRLKQVDYSQVLEFLQPLLDMEVISKRLKAITADEDRVAYLRAEAINALVGETVEEFMRHQLELMQGVFNESLISCSRLADAMKCIKALETDRIYTAREVLEVEVPGFEVLGGLLTAFITAVDDIAENGNKASLKSRTIIRLLPRQFLASSTLPHGDRYARLLKVTDFIAGMTDSYAVSLFRQISGISLPQR